MDVLTNVDRPRIAALRHSGTFFWLDLESPPDADLEALGGLLGLHPLALEDTREFGQRPKLDSYGDHLLLVFYAARLDARAFAPLEVHLYVSGEFILTVRRERCAKLESLHELLLPEDTSEE